MEKNQITEARKSLITARLQSDITALRYCIELVNNTGIGTPKDVSTLFNFYKYEL